MRKTLSTGLVYTKKPTRSILKLRNACTTQALSRAHTYRMGDHNYIRYYNLEIIIKGWVGGDYNNRHFTVALPFEG